MATLFVRSRSTTIWVASHAQTLGDKVIPTSATSRVGMQFEATTVSGNTGGSEPTWPTAIGGTVVDGGVTWTARGGAQKWLASQPYNVGDICVKVGASNGNLGNAVVCVWKCTTAGTSNSSEPSWPTTITSGTTTQTDSGVTWTAQKASSWDLAHPYMAALLHDQNNSTIRVNQGDVVYASKFHNELINYGVGVPINYTFPGNNGGIGGSASQLLSVDDTGQNGAGSLSVASGATFAAISGQFGTMYIAGWLYVYGCTFDNNSTSGDLTLANNNGYGAAANGGVTCELCIFKVRGRNLTIGASATAYDWARMVSCTIDFNSNSGSNFNIAGCLFSMKGGSVINAASGATFCSTAGSSRMSNLTLEAVDFSSFTGTGSYIWHNPSNGGAGNNGTAKILMSDCKIAAGLIGITDTVAHGGNNAFPGVGWFEVTAINCDSGGTNYKTHYCDGCGTLDESTSVTRTGGATNGTTAQSWQMITGPNTNWPQPLESLPIVTWNDNSGSSKTATIEIICDQLANLNNDDIWMELVYLQDSGDPLGGYVNSTKANVLASNAALTSSSASWGGTGGMTHPNAQKLSVTFTPQQKGTVLARVFLAKASQTVYVDPLLTIS